MKLDVKANIGDLIYYLQENGVHSAPVLKIKITVDNEQTQILYETCHNKGLHEVNVFNSRKELAYSLL